MIPLKKQKHPDGQRGVVLIMFALVLIVLLGLTALAIDVARMNLTKVELQNAADAAALGGAGSLVNPSLSDYDWDTAEQEGLVVAQQNIVNGKNIQDGAVVESGYWNLETPSFGFRVHGTGSPATGEVPAVRATVTLANGQTDGPLKLFFAPFLGFNESSLQATAIAVIGPPEGGVGMFPFAFGKEIYDNFWDSSTGKPKDLNGDGVIDEQDQIQVNLDSFYPKGGAGNWTSFTTEDQSDSNLQSLVQKSTITSIEIGTSIWIVSGTKSNIYKLVPTNIDVAIPVVPTFTKDKKGKDITPGTWQPVLAIAGFHIDGIGGKGNKQYITGHLIDPKSIPGLFPGSGTGVSYGAFTPPYLVQ